MKRSYIPLVLAVIAVVALASSGIGARAGWWHFRSGFAIMKYAAFLGVAVALISALMLMIPKMRAGQAAPLALALALALIAALLPYSWMRKAKSVPPIHDITTDTQNPPQFVAVLPLRKDAPNPAEYGGDSIAVQQKEAYPDIRPLMLPQPPALAFKAALAEAKNSGWKIVAQDSAAGRIEATATTRWYGFKDDVVVRIQPAGRGTKVDVRSVSRVGRSDVGTNAARIRKYLARLNA